MESFFVFLFFSLLFCCFFFFVNDERTNRMVREKNRMTKKGKYNSNAKATLLIPNLRTPERAKTHTADRVIKMLRD